ncbi:MAG TPA: protein kinase, partial [Planctomycetota bacterium]|nr:protein kinase [Planctomycetota bacterium]
MQFGPYEVTAEIGRGGMGVVWRGRALEAASPEVAIKALARATPEGRARFERERRLLAGLGEAEGFVPLLDAGVEGETPFLVMPFVPGGTLRKKIDAGPLAVDEAVALGASVAQALGRAHAKGIVHRDLKPENILFTAAGVPLVADLGLGKHFQADAASVSLSRPGAARGTWGYMPREQMEDSKKVDARADVFALGAIIFECVTGEPPFSDDMTAALARIAEGFVPSLLAVKPDAPPWLARVLARALAPKPADRFASGTELALALQAGEAARAPRALLVAAGVLLLAALAAVLASRRPSPASRPQPDTVAEEASARHAAKVAALVRDTVERARKLSLAHKADESIACYSSAIALDPSLASAWAERGDLRCRMLDAAGGLADLSRAIELDPKFAGAWAGRAFARYLGNDFQGALSDASRSVALDPKLARGWALRAMANWYVAKDLDLIIADASKAIELDPRVAIAWG